MIRKNILFFVSFLLILFLSSCGKNSGRSVSNNSSSLNNSEGELAKMEQNDYLSSSGYGLGKYNLTAQEKEKIISKEKRNILSNFKQDNSLKNNTTPTNDIDAQRSHGLTNKEMIKIERADRLNTFNKTRPSGSREYNNDFPIYNNHPFPKNH
jgi:hypothetical protein